MAVVEPSSPSTAFSWRQEKTLPTPKKSHGIPPAKFHLKQHQEGHAIDSHGNGDEPSSLRDMKETSVPEWKERTERNLLIQEQKSFTKELEDRRKGFRRITQLKTWPLQDMAMDHLDHLLGINASYQFHGGDYLSAESSSSVSSVESSKPRLKTTTMIKTLTTSTSDNPTADDSNKKTQSQEIRGGYHDFGEQSASVAVEESIDNQKQQRSPLWSLEPRIFATEKGAGKRKYLVGQFGRIADWYWRKTEPTSRHLYEVIREGTPCRLYFDLEFSRAHNPSVPTTQLLHELEDELATELQMHYGTFLPRLKSSQIVNLDSSNEKKFSRHWIVHLFQEPEGKEGKHSTTYKQEEEFLFKDAPTVGRFIKRMVGRLADDIGVEGGDFSKKRPALYKYLFVNMKDEGKRTCFIDLGVYTRNRLFRCFGSSKKGKTSALQAVLSERVEPNVEYVAKDVEGSNKLTDTATERHYFPLSIPPKKEVSASQSSRIQSFDDFIVANDWEPHAQALADSLVVPLKQGPQLLASTIGEDNSNNLIKILDVEEGSYGSTSVSGFLDSSKATSQRRYPSAIPMARQGSPLPSLDQYVVDNLSNRGGVQGSIRAWSIEYGPRETPVSFTYHIQKNRFCEIIGRPHKSNGIFWTIDVSSWTCIQGCFDRECYGRGCPIPISNDGKQSGKGGRLDKIKEEFESWQEEEFEKALMALNLDHAIASQNDTEQSGTPTHQSGNDAKKDEEELYDSDSLSDDALLQAALNNPELFP
ncbi:unnamed protein product [Pseudo-nitzschia multistriata]|uniref:DNA-directed primase/polymerase protein n=1 Tax=Pseudo-nitzschia multistriata TaxID=183589 RepID=A0A448ZH21_9STRA|nr:unnamed protein product [Pseudo-nitzschia multistriata]